MPFDIPRDDGSNNNEDSLPNIPDYDFMNIPNDIHNDSDFDFSSDDDNENNDDVNNGIIPIDIQDRYANYELIRQIDNNNDNEVRPDNNHNNVSHSDDNETNENYEMSNQNLNQYFQHNFIVQWIETDEPLFDQAQYDAQQHESQNVENVDLLLTESSGRRSNDHSDADNENNSTQKINISSSQESESSNHTDQNISKFRSNQVKLDNGKLSYCFLIELFSNVSISLFINRKNRYYKRFNVKFYTT